MSFSQKKKTVRNSKNLLSSTTGITLPTTLNNMVKKGVIGTHRTVYTLLVPDVA